MLPSQQRYSWSKSVYSADDQSNPDKVASNKSRHRRHHLVEAKQARRVSRSGAEISDTIASVEGEATLRLLADPMLYAEFQERVKKHRPATNVATHELLKQFLAEKKYCDEKKTKVKNIEAHSDAPKQAQLLPRTGPGRLGNFLSRNQERQNRQRAAAASAGDGSLPSLEEVGEKNRIQRRNSMDVVSMASSSSVSTHTTSASTYASSIATDNSSFEVSLSGLIQSTNWFPGLKGSQ